MTKTASPRRPDQVQSGNSSVLNCFGADILPISTRSCKRAVESAGLDDPTYVGWHQHLLAKTWLAFSNAQLGFLDKGRELATQCIEESEQVGELSHLMLALNAHNVFCFYCDDAGAISERALRLEELSFRYGVAWYQPAALLARAWAGLRIGAALLDTRSLEARAGHADNWDIRANPRRNHTCSYCPLTLPTPWECLKKHWMMSARR